MEEQSRIFLMFLRDINLLVEISFLVLSEIFSLPLSLPFSSSTSLGCSSVEVGVGSPLGFLVVSFEIGGKLTIGSVVADNKLPLA